MNLFTLLLILIYLKINLFLFLKTIPIIILLSILYGSLSQAIDSFAFRIKKIENTLHKIIWAPNHLMQQYPVLFFKDVPFKIVFLIFHLTFIATLIMPILKNQNPIYFLEQILTIIFLIFIFSGIIYFNWHYGLKKYEAFG